MTDEASQRSGIGSGEALRCEGAPRDLGLDQGRGLAARVRVAASDERGNWLDRLRRRTSPDALDARAARDTTRFFPHMAERLAGLAAGARVDERDLYALLARELSPPPRGGLLATSREHASGAALVARAVPAAPGPELALRQSVPDNDFRSMEVVSPWLVPAMAGVNEHGLAVAVSVGPATPDSLRACAAPAVLLVQDCLQRFDALEAAVEWCMGRPAGGVARIVLADAEGRAAAVEVAGSERRVDRGSAGLLLGNVRPDDRAALEKACVDGAPDEAALVAIVREHPRAAPAAVLLDPAGRRLAICRDGANAWLDLPTEGGRTAA